MSKQNNDAVIKDLLQKVEDQKASLGTKEKVAWNTNGVFKYRGGDFFNLNTVTDPTVLANALAVLISQESSFKDACKRLGIKADYKWDGYAVSDWEEDFLTRMRVIEWDKKKKTLDTTKAKLNTLVSEEAKTEMELEDIKKLLA